MWRAALSSLAPLAVAGCLELAGSEDSPASGGMTGSGGSLSDAAWPDAPGSDAPSGGTGGGAGGSPPSGGGAPSGGGRSSGGAPAGGGTTGGGSGGAGAGGTGGTGGTSGGGGGAGGSGGTSASGGGGGSGGACAPVAKIQGPLTPTGATSLSLLGTVAWTYPTNALAEDGAWANAQVKQTEISNYLAVTWFGAAVPSNATVTGVVFTVTRMDVNKILDAGVRLVNSGAALGADHSSNVEWKTQLKETVTYGGSTDTWSTTLTPSQVNAAGFGIGIAVKSADPTNAFAQTGRVDSVELTLYYSVPGC